MTSKEFREARKKLGLTQNELAQIMGMNQPGIARLESGERQPTKQHSATIKLILLLDKYLLLDEILRSKT